MPLYDYRVKDGKGEGGRRYASKAEGVRGVRMLLDFLKDETFRRQAMEFEPFFTEMEEWLG